jgi:hypothetical protein
LGDEPPPERLLSQPTDKDRHVGAQIIIWHLNHLWGLIGWQEQQLVLRLRSHHPARPDPDHSSLPHAGDVQPRSWPLPMNYPTVKLRSRPRPVLLPPLEEQLPPRVEKRPRRRLVACPWPIHHQRYQSRGDVLPSNKAFGALL